MRFTIGRKIGAGFGVLIVLTIAVFFLAIYTVNQSTEINKDIQEVRTPSMKALNELNMLITESKGLFYYWVYFPSRDDAKEKQQLREIQNVKIPAVRTLIVDTLSLDWSAKEREEVDSIFKEIDRLVDDQREIMETLSDMAAYSDFMIRSETDECMEPEIEGNIYDQLHGIMEHLDHLISVHKEKSDLSNEDMVESLTDLSYVVSVSGFVLVFGGMLIAFFTVRMIVKPVNSLKDLLLKMSLGVLPEDQPINRNDEIGEMAQALEKLVGSMQSQTDFSRAVGGGQFDAQYSPLSDEDTLGYALLKMRDELKDLTSGLEEKVRERTAEVVKQQKEIEEKNLKLEKLYDDVTDSIRYAKRLQDTILPPDNYVNDHLDDAFILFKPKDIVSGDFYWMEDTKKSVLIAAADCTGHGVPGAFMSLVSSNLLNKAVNEKGLEQPAAILNEVSKGVANKSPETLKSKDGMDVSIIRVDKAKKKLEWAGANNAMYYVRNGEIDQVKADKHAIEVFQDVEKQFTNHTFDIQEGDVYYIFSDGYPDQFGGPKGRKFMYKRFRNYLAEIHKEPMDKQKQLLDNTIEEWRGSSKQIDDILVIGIRF